MMSLFRISSVLFLKQRARSMRTNVQNIWFSRRFPSKNRVKFGMIFSTGSLKRHFIIVAIEDWHSTPFVPKYVQLSLTLELRAELLHMSYNDVYVQILLNRRFKASIF